METQLLAYGTHQAHISKPVDGVPTRAHMEKRVKNMTRTYGADSKEAREAREQLHGPSIDETGQRVWNLYLQIQRWRGVGGMGAAPITLHDLDAFERRYGFSLTPFECDCIKSLDLAYLNTRADS
jgi:hypothetical protein